MGLGLLGALPQEIDLLKKKLEVASAKRIAGREFASGFLFGREVVVALSGIGKVSSASAATIMLREFDCTSLLFIGVAGGVSKRVAVGDVVVAATLVQHDFDATPIYPTKFHLPSVNCTELTCDTEMAARCIIAAETYLENDFETDVTSEIRQAFGLSRPAVHCGLVLSGDTFIDDPGEMNAMIAKVKDVLPGVEPMAVEMEGAAVAQVCQEFGIPYSVVRVISDSADENATVDFARFVDSIASHFSIGIVKRYLEAL